MKTTSTLFLAAIAVCMLFTTSCKKDDSSGSSTTTIARTNTSSDYLSFNSIKYNLILDTVMIDTQNDELNAILFAHHAGDTIVCVLGFNSSNPRLGSHSLNVNDNDAYLYIESNSIKGVSKEGICNVGNVNGKNQITFNNIVILDNNGIANLISGCITSK